MFLRLPVALLLCLWANCAWAQQYPKRLPGIIGYKIKNRQGTSKGVVQPKPVPLPDTASYHPPESGDHAAASQPLPVKKTSLRRAVHHVKSTGSPAAAANNGFPWPPRPYSEEVNLPAKFFANVHTLGEADDHLSQVLTHAQYRNFRYYALPEQPGFALVTKFEQISYGYVPLPEPGRWSLDTTPCPGFSPLCLARSLVFPSNGYWRVFVFVVTDRPLPSAVGTAPSSEEADLWFGQGTNKLPAELRKLPFTADHYAAVLVYEFNKKEGQPVVLVPRCRRDGFTQLQLVGIRY